MSDEDKQGNNLAYDRFVRENGNSNTPADTTIDSEADYVLLAFGAQARLQPNKPLKSLGYYSEATHAIANLIAQEANKARIDELERVLIMASTPKTRTSASIRKVVKSWIVFLSDELTADKESNNGQ